MYLPIIMEIKAKKMVGCKRSMSLAANQTSALWRMFMPLSTRIKHLKSDLLYALQIYPAHIDFSAVDPSVLFESWAAMEVGDFEEVPNGLDKLSISGGLYAKFSYRGLAANFTTALHAMIHEGLNHALYELDSRPHFMVMQPDYSPTDPDAEEEVWLPIRVKN